jgi:hypothetical protein
VAAIAASIKEWGWTSSALVGEDGGLIAGHARILAARQLGIAEIPVMVAAGWTEAQKRAYVLADNQLAITGSGWDPELLRSTVATDVARVLGGVEPHLMVTDPPYGVEYDPDWRNQAARNGATAGRARGADTGRIRYPTHGTAVSTPTFPIVTVTVEVGFGA